MLPNRIQMQNLSPANLVVAGPGYISPEQDRRRTTGHGLRVWLAHVDSHRPVPDRAGQHQDPLVFAV